MNNPENTTENSTGKIESLQSSSERQETLSKNPEKQSELAPRDVESRLEKARDDALEKAVSVESNGKENIKSEKVSPNSKRPTISKRELNNSFKHTIKQVQNELPIASRTFSKFIHNNAVEKSSEVIGKTIARPNSILAGAVTAFLATLLIYVVAKTNGYRLSGFETIGAFAIGWCIGVVFDYLRLLFTGKKY